MKGWKEDKSRIIETEIHSWMERYDLVKQFWNSKQVFIMIPYKEIEKDTHINYLTDNLNVNQYVYFEGKITPKGNLALISIFDWPWSGSSECETAFRIYSPEGNPITKWQSDWSRYSQSEFHSVFNDN